MIIIAEANMLPALSEADKKVLLGMSGTDKVIVLSDKKSQVPIETMQLFMAMKAKTEFIQLDDLKMGFGLGYRYGLFAAAYSKDKVKILTNNDYSNIISSNMVCVKSLSAAKKTVTAKKVTATKNEEVPKKATSKAAEKGATKTSVKEAGTKKEVLETKEAPVKTSTRKPKLKDLSADSLIATYPALKPYKTKISTLNGMLKDAINKSTDPNVSFKMQLQMIFADDAEDIWKVVKKDYAKLKILAEV